MRKYFTDKWKKKVLSIGTLCFLTVFLLLQTSCGKTEEMIKETSENIEEIQKTDSNENISSENSDSSEKMPDMSKTSVESSSVQEEWTTNETESLVTEPEQIETSSILQEEQEETIPLESESFLESTEDIAVPSGEEGELVPSSDILIAEETVDEFFRRSVFVGDSVMKGFRNYVSQQEMGFLGEPQFLTSGSYSLRMAMTPIGEDTIHPIYEGEQRLVQDSIQMMGARRVFLSLGLNDLGMNTPEWTRDAYISLIGLIREKSPEIQVYVISTTYMAAGSERQDLNNANIRILNQYMKAYCESAEGIDYIEIADYLMDENGALKKEYCSDEYVHQTKAAYQVWIQLLRNYAAEKSFKGEEVESEETIAEEENFETSLQGN